VRLTIERMRTVILVAGVLLVIALGVFLTIGHWRSPFSRRDLPSRLGINIQQEANGFTHAEFHAGHATFKITASKVEQMKDNHYRLHVVKIEMYSPSGDVDKIEGSEFEYDQQAGIAKATGPVEITLHRPHPADAAGTTKKQPAKVPGHAGSGTPIAPADPAASQIHVRTSGLTFDQNSGVATTSQHVDFDLTQGSGSSTGASYDSQNGNLILDRAVELNTHRGGDPVRVQAQHAEIDRDDNLCRLKAGTATFRQGSATAQQATILFRDDGSAERLDGSQGVTMKTANGGKVAAPAGTLAFNQNNQPKDGHLEGGVTIDSDNGVRHLRGTSPTAALQFDAQGLLRHVHLERKVNFASDEKASGSNGPQQLHREWASPVADLEYRTAGKGQVELDSIHGVEGVVVTTETRGANRATAHGRMTADDVRGSFGDNSALKEMTGVGHARIDQTTETGTAETTTGDRLEAHFFERAPDQPKRAGANDRAAESQIESATMTGNVVLFQQPAAKPGSAAPAALRATADRADYEGAGEWLHLTGNPRVENGGMQLTADKVDVARASGDAFAHGNVKATWFGDGSPGNGNPGGGARTGGNAKTPDLGEQGPTHAVAAEAQMHQQTGETTFRGQARLWQQANSVAAPTIVLDRMKQTLVARTANPSEPVHVVLLSASTPGQNKTSQGTPSVIRVRGGDLKYSDGERKAVMHGGVLGNVVAETGDATTHSTDLDLILLPPGNHAGKAGGPGQVDRMTARGHVTIESQGRHGTGDQLDYTSESDEYILTGSAAAPPRMTDPNRGTVTGGALIFNSRDDSVNVEGDGRATTTETTAPKRP
jgi:lipopolysaccharide export system protein LptA